MGDEVRDAEQGAAVELFDEEVDALAVERFVGGGEVDQVAVVGDGLLEPKAPGVVLPEGDALGGEGGATPDLLALGEDLDCGESDSMGRSFPLDAEGWLSLSAVLEAEAYIPLRSNRRSEERVAASNLLGPVREPDRSAYRY